MAILEQTWGDMSGATDKGRLELVVMKRTVVRRTNLQEIKDGPKRSWVDVSTSHINHHILLQK